MINFDDILQQLRSSGASVQQQGFDFERVVKYYLENEPIYKDFYTKVYLWTQWQQKHNRNQQDTGIDLVAEGADGSITAIQAKFYQADSHISRADIDSFLAAASKKEFSNLMLVSTTTSWSKHTETALENNTKECTRIGLNNLRNGVLDWKNFIDGGKPAKRIKKSPRPHQQEAIKAVCNGLQTAARGKMIMACGTGKTYTSLRIAEKMVGAGGHVLFLVPSLSLLSQALHEWSAECSNPLRNFLVCSDTHVGRTREEDISIHDLALPATTSAKKLAARLQQKFEQGSERLNVVFATYHSIDVIAEAQKKHNSPQFDLIICDEAHRTTGSEKINETGAKEESYYIKVHNSDYLQANKRLYMTATPRIYSADSQTKAKEQDIAVYSMDDTATYGEELYRLGFAEAVDKDLLSDYKVLVLAVSETAAAASMAKQGSDGTLNLADNAKLIGCWNGLAKKFTANEDEYLPDNQPMRRAVAFATTIIKSKQITAAFNNIAEHITPGNNENNASLQCEARHVDGSMNAMHRAKEIEWLRNTDSDSDTQHPTCRILSNARCLSEGVDVPALDAVMFLHPRKSQIDVVQSVGRVMRRAEGKKYGYVILPIVIPSEVEPEDALNNNPDDYKVVWQVLQALRAHDERFNAMINQLELNKQRPNKIRIIGIGSGNGADGADSAGETTQPYQQSDISFPNFPQWEEAILARIVKKCGSKDYWENWAKDVGIIAQNNVSRIQALLASPNDTPRKRFDQFLKKLQKNLNPHVSEADAIEMLSQHMITHPIFDALFEGYEFAKQNPVSKSMQQIVNLLEKNGLEKETEKLTKFYQSVSRRAAGIDNAAAKQKIMLELYDKFFATAFKKQSEKLGIVYTPVEVVDFILNSADKALQKEFKRKLTHKDVHILDPFTGTGTFIARLLRQDNPLIEKKDLVRKYKNELHANEITLLAYYIAAVNIEEIYHDRSGEDYQPFGGIVLTDTFQLNEGMTDTLSDEILQENSDRAKRQRKKPIQVIIGNPPYSVGQRSGNDDNKNEKYSQLDKRITDTYVKDVIMSNKNSLYDSYIRSIRWASDRIVDEGIVAFVTNGSFIDGNATAGLRKHLLKDFSAVYCFNLRGNARTQGEQRRKEKGNVFYEGTRTPVAITILIKKKNKNEGKLYYYDIGDYLNRKEKLDKVQEYQHYENIPWQSITPNKENDWINQRAPAFQHYIPLGVKENKGKGKTVESIFTVYSNGVKTNKDAWVYNFSHPNLSTTMKKMINFYNSQVADYQKTENISHENFINRDPKKISWDSELIQNLSCHKKGKYEDNKIRQGMYRPYVKQWLYFDKQFNSRTYRIPAIFPTSDTKNLAISVSGVGASKDFSALMVDTLPDLEVVSKGQCFPLYNYVKEETGGLLPTDNTPPEGQRQENIPDATLKKFQQKYSDNSISKEDIFYYIYGILHAPDYKQRFAADLTKMLPRIPQVKKHTDFTTFMQAGRALANLHLNYETAPEYKVGEQYADLYTRDNLTVKKMRFAGKQGAWDKSTIHYNAHLSITNIPPEAYDYQVNGKSAIEWIMSQYKVSVDKESGITNNPNDWSEDPKYILSLLKRIIHISKESAKTIKSLPKLEV